MSASDRVDLSSLLWSQISVALALAIRVLAAQLTDRVAIRVGIIFVCLVVDLLRRVADVLLPVASPVKILVAHLRGSLDVATHVNTVDHAADQCKEAEDQKDDAQYPVKENVMIRQEDQLQSRDTHHT